MPQQIDLQLRFTSGGRQLGPDQLKAISDLTRPCYLRWTSHELDNVRVTVTAFDRCQSLLYEVTKVPTSAPKRSKTWEGSCKLERLRDMQDLIFTCERTAGPEAGIVCTQQWVFYRFFPSDCAVDTDPSFHMTSGPGYLHHGTDTSAPGSDCPLPAPTPGGAGAFLMPTTSSSASKVAPAPLSLFARCLVIGKPALLAPTPGRDGAVFLPDTASADGKRKKAKAFVRRLKGDLDAAASSSSSPPEEEDDDEEEDEDEDAEEESSGDVDGEEEDDDEQEEESESERCACEVCQPKEEPLEAEEEEDPVEEDDEDAFDVDEDAMNADTAYPDPNPVNDDDEPSASVSDLKRDFERAITDAHDLESALCTTREAIATYVLAELLKESRKQPGVLLPRVSEDPKENRRRRLANVYAAASSTESGSVNARVAMLRLCLTQLVSEERFESAAAYLGKRKREDVDEDRGETGDEEVVGQGKDDNDGRPLRELPLSPLIKRLQRRHPSRSSQYAAAKAVLAAEEIDGDVISYLGTTGLHAAGVTLGVAASIVKEVEQDMAA